VQELFGAIHRIGSELSPRTLLYRAYDAATDKLTFPYHVDEYDTDFPSKTTARDDRIRARTASRYSSTRSAAELERRGEVS